MSVFNINPNDEIIKIKPANDNVLVNGMTLIDHWTKVYKPQLDWGNLLKIVAFDTYFFNALDSGHLVRLMELFLRETGRDGAVVNVLERNDIVICAPTLYLVNLNLQYTNANVDSLVVVNLPIEELFWAVTRLIRSRDEAFSPVEAARPVAVARVEKIPRPANAFILYRQSMNEKVKLDNPEMHNNERSKIIGATWAAESQAVRDHWLRKADAAKRQHALAHPDYKYQPRKPAEKKRRISRKKAAALAINLDADAAAEAAAEADAAADAAAGLELAVGGEINAPNHGVFNQVSFTVNGGPQMFYHAENDFRLTPPESPAAEQNDWVDFGDDFIANDFGANHFVGDEWMNVDDFLQELA